MTESAYFEHDITTMLSLGYYRGKEGGGESMGGNPFHVFRKLLGEAKMSKFLVFIVLKLCKHIMSDK